MIGFAVWIGWALGCFLVLVQLDLFPPNHPGNYAASLFCVMSGLLVGGLVNQYIRDHYPKIDRWNT